jgi:hypothetical protein
MSPQNAKASVFFPSLVRFWQQQNKVEMGQRPLQRIFWGKIPQVHHILKRKGLKLSLLNNRFLLQ